MAIDGTFLSDLSLETCTAPPGKFRIVAKDTLAQSEFVHDDVPALTKAQRIAGEITGGHVTDAQTARKVYIFNDEGKVVGEAGTM